MQRNAMHVKNLYFMVVFQTLLDIQLKYVTFLQYLDYSNIHLLFNFDKRNIKSAGWQCISKASLLKQDI